MVFFFFNLAQEYRISQKAQGKTIEWFGGKYLISKYYYRITLGSTTPITNTDYPHLMARSEPTQQASSTGSNMDRQDLA